MEHLLQRIGGTLGAALVGACLLSNTASAGLLCAVGTAGFGCAGPGIANDSGLGFTSITNLGVNFLLADGLAVSLDINETFTGNLGANPTLSATMRVTNVVAQNLGPLAVSDNIYFLSDVFNPSVPGTGGVGAVGQYGAAAALGAPPVAGVYSASSQAQMNFLFAPLFGLGLAPGFSYTTPSTFAVGAPALPFTFYEWARGPAAGGVVQLVGGLNFTLAPGSEIFLPGSVVVDDNDPATFISETPEPATFAGIGSGLVGLAMYFRGRRK